MAITRNYKVQKDFKTRNDVVALRTMVQVHLVFPNSVGHYQCELSDSEDHSPLGQGIQLIWTWDFQDALTRMARDKDKTVMSAANKTL